MNKACKLLLDIVKTHVMLYGRQQMSGCLIRMDLLLYSLQEKLKEKLITISLKKIVVEVILNISLQQVLCEKDWLKQESNPGPFNREPTVLTTTNMALIFWGLTIAFRVQQSNLFFSSGLRQHRKE